MGGLVQGSSITSSSVRLSENSTINGSSNVGLVFGRKDPDVTITSTHATINSSHGSITFLNWNISQLGSWPLFYPGAINISKGRIDIDENLLLFNPSFNSSANVTFVNAAVTGFPIQFLNMGFNGKVCNAGTSPVCVNFTSLSVSPAKFNVSYLGRNITLGMLGNHMTEIQLKQGWNLISLSDPEANQVWADCLSENINSWDSDDTGSLMPPQVLSECQRKNVSIELKHGWNLIGYSSPVEESMIAGNPTGEALFRDIAEVTNAEETVDWMTASSNGWVQRYPSYYQNENTFKRYEFVGLSSRHEVGLRENRGYWIYNYLPTPINLTLKNVLPVNFSVQKSFPIRNLMFRNDTSGEMRNVTEAKDKGLFQGGIYFWNLNEEYFDSFTLESRDSLFNWNGYFVNSKYSNFTIIIST
ncbi:MAG: hypothetical protein DDT42_01918 [candidate division WS2 bacterium]|uniref:Uncharacterized protein n=1 Tax=Psychracetigena formicireducens TaxID=2986056 RepID=A0A9E2F205_PSYF1|nr:hypothetical protein [Candidatus Psychracetigena formicireducens]